MSSTDDEQGSSSEVTVDPVSRDQFWDSFLVDAVVRMDDMGTDETPEIDGFLDDELLALLAHDELDNFEINDYDDYDYGPDLSDTSSTDTGSSSFDD